MSSAAEPPDISECNEKSRRVLKAVSEAGDEATTSTIREYARLSGSDPWNHAESLCADGLLEKIRVGEPGGKPNKYSLTTAGKQALANYTADSDELSLEARIAGLESEVAQLREEQSDEGEANTNELEQRVGRLEQRFETMKERMRSEAYVAWLREQLF